MLLSEEDIAEFQELCRRRLGKELSATEAHEQALKLLVVVEAFMKPSGARSLTIDLPATPARRVQNVTPSRAAIDNEGLRNANGPNPN